MDTSAGTQQDKVSLIQSQVCTGEPALLEGREQAKPYADPLAEDTSAALLPDMSISFVAMSVPRLHMNRLKHRRMDKGSHWRSESSLYNCTHREGS